MAPPALLAAATGHGDLLFGLFAIFVVVAMVAGTVIRDDETGFAPILRSTRIGKGAYLGGRDHTTVLNGLRRTEKLVQSDPAVRQATGDLKRLLLTP